VHRGQGRALVLSLFAHSVPVYRCTLAASSSRAWPLVPDCLLIVCPVYPAQNDSMKLNRLSCTREANDFRELNGLYCKGAIRTLRAPCSAVHRPKGLLFRVEGLGFRVHGLGFLNPTADGDAVARQEHGGLHAERGE